MTILYPRLYHGTAEKAVPGILKDGIQPRGKKKGNWKHTIESNPDAVYLTDSYAIHFASNATKDTGQRLAVIEVDVTKLSVLNLAPDEDFLEQATRKQSGPDLAPIDRPMRYRTRWYRRRAQNYGPHWLDSLKHLGTCTYYGTVPAQAITRIAFIEPEAYFGLVFGGGIDPMITLLNYTIMGVKYRNSVRRLFGEELEPDPQEKQLESVVDADTWQARREAEMMAWAHPGIKIQNISWENGQPRSTDQVKLWKASKQQVDEID